MSTCENLYFSETSHAAKSLPTALKIMQVKTHQIVLPELQCHTIRSNLNTSNIELFIKGITLTLYFIVYIPKLSRDSSYLTVLTLI